MVDDRQDDISCRPHDVYMEFFVLEEQLILDFLIFQMFESASEYIQNIESAAFSRSLFLLKRA